MMVIKETIKSILNAVLEDTDVTLSQPLTTDTVLLETGLDSLGFAILVAKLEDELGFDPFVMMDEAVYPKTFGEFIQIYENAQSEHVPI